MILNTITHYIIIIVVNIIKHITTDFSIFFRPISKLTQTITIQCLYIQTKIIYYFLNFAAEVKQLILIFWCMTQFCNILRASLINYKFSFNLNDMR